MTQLEYSIEKDSQTKATFFITKTFSEDYKHTQAYEVRKIEKKGFGKAIELKFADSSAPTFSLKNLLEIADFFGTQDIDFDNSIQSEGCPTCGAGSEFGYELQIYRITKHYPFK